ncbi:S-layer homology domain-containing protein [Paenibacillus sp. UNCCL117]|uniref:immunoglobulin-like domain-containing protein n=1 Tax=unclassified Paenibacillus TaxID=185978 RepID=UPI000883C9E6|nr:MULTISPECIES: immunoglobulin-like domain-containing protein [unclassified Paenibacillus]SDC05603.1 S-layer homology domain-containing protein [Paenibacillus sp. cl123]SFW37625.1 S-layer homology domain-containing protein [Paenibacillus sp. UNCCL117]
MDKSRRWVKRAAIGTIVLALGTSGHTAMPPAVQAAAPAPAVVAAASGQTDAAATAAAEPPLNLALNRPAEASSSTSSREPGKANDTDATGTWWQPAGADRTDLNVWWSVDLGEKRTFNAVDVHLNRVDNLSSIRVYVSDDKTGWTPALAKKPSNKDELLLLDQEVAARYVKVEFMLSRDLNLNLFELGIYRHTSTETPPPADLEAIYFTDEAGRPYTLNEEIRLPKDGLAKLTLKGRRTSGGEIDMGGILRQLTSSAKNVAIDASGSVQALAAGASRVYAEVAMEDGRKLLTPDLWIVVTDAADLLAEALIANTSLSHPTMKAEIGQPALLAPGDAYPAVTVQANVALQVHGVLLRDGTPVLQVPGGVWSKGESRSLSLEGTAAEPGSYELRLTLTPDGEGDVYDSFYFTVLPPAGIPSGQSSVAYLGEDGKLAYVPDYKGNRVLDFSHAGYKGGGVKLPDVQARIAVEPGEGDDTARIQAAVDQVSKLPLSADGFRGAVLLKKGRYEIGGKLTITASGVVLRGEGQGEDGTLLYATGAVARNLLEIGGSAALTVDTSSATPVADLYVPAGARSFRVKDASGFRAGDTVIVRRFGNARFIRDIGMDYIYMRPGTNSTAQWGTFNLDFDRVITAVDGNTVTVDAPLASAVELKYGGASLMKYSDAARIENVGVENIRVDTEFDPSVIDTVMDNGKTDPYHADEKHAERFVVLNSVKNAWVRNITAYHLSYALAQIGRNAKWVTVQDSEMYDMVSIITGGRRYVYYIQGQLSLVQRTYAETARHAFVLDSRVQGPNVFLDSSAERNYNTSEPHHKWSVGGLFDGIRAPISIRDRAWLGSGHGWAGANYVTWNTEGELTSQQPPTAQNYAIGHIGTVVPGLVPDKYDKRPRKEAYWESVGRHVEPGSLYKQQLLERLGEQALSHIAQSPVGGGELDNPQAGQEQLPLLTDLRVDGRTVAGFKPDLYDYVVSLPLGTTNAPRVEASAQAGDTAEIMQADSPGGKAVITVRRPGGSSLLYTVQFHTLPVSGPLPQGLMPYPIAAASAGDSHASYPPQNAADGDVGTRWAGKGNQWIQFDLGRPRLVSHVLLARFGAFKYNFTIELSLDGSQWSTVYSGTSSGLADVLENHPVPDTMARYVRIAGTGNDQDAWNNLNEIVIAGDVPAIRLLGDNPAYAEAMTSYTDAGAAAYDPKDGDLTSRITVSGSVYTNRIGRYTVSYDVYDADGHAAETVTRAVYVRDTTPPVIRLNGSADIALDYGSAFHDPLATAADTYDGDLTGSIVIAGQVDTSRPGVYTLTYQVKDSSGNAAEEVIRTVRVREEESSSGSSAGGDTGSSSAGGSPSSQPKPLAETSKDGQTLLELAPEQLDAFMKEHPVTDGELAFRSASQDPAIVLRLPDATLAKLAAEHPELKLRVSTTLGDYVLPLAALPLPAMAERLKTKPEAVTIEIRIAKGDDSSSGRVSELLTGGGWTALAAPVEYSVTALAGGLRTEWNNFGMYVERTIPVTETAQLDPGLATVLVFDPGEGRMQFVPSVFVKTNTGSWQAVAKRTGNSLYVVAQTKRTFDDLHGHWAANDLSLLASKRIVDGVSERSFDPDGRVTRAQFASLLVRGLGLADARDAGAAAAFVDMPATAPYGAAIGTATAHGLIQGYEDGSFRPDAPVSREELAVLIDRAYTFAARGGASALSAPAAKLGSAYADQADIAVWARDSVFRLRELGMVEGQELDRFAPQRTASRAEAGVMLKRLLKQLAFLS